MIKAKKVRAPSALREKRRYRGESFIWNRKEWSANRLGPPFIKEPEQMRKISIKKEVEDYPILEDRIRNLIGIRAETMGPLSSPYQKYPLTLLRGRSGAYYVKVGQLYANRSYERVIESRKGVFVKVKNKEIIEALKFLEGK